ncbi:unnamed protein product [Rotaria sordida]|uniref:Uncharacterized protein n=1 Tax=Rotaria sordida TaxID=392033 RepID=A0A813VB72_9BILA|nr:unnamed protein product [Rotaria sordida]
MSKFFQRVRNVFRKNGSSQNITNNTAEDFNDEQIKDTDTRLAYRENEDLDSVSDETENINNNNNSSQQKNLKQQQKQTTSLETDSSSNSLSLHNSELRKRPNNFQSGLSRNNNMNRNINPSVKNNAVLIRNPTTQKRLSSQSQNSSSSSRSQSSINNLPSEQLAIPLKNQILQPPLHDNFLTPMNRYRRPFPIKPNSTLVGFSQRNPSHLRFNQQLQNSSYNFNRPFFSNQLNRPFFKNRLLPFQSQNKISNYEIDYPIENVLFDKNIPSTMAIKINEAVEYDRFGNTYYNRHYAYEPSIQHINIGNRQQIDRHLIENSRPEGMRYIREINNNYDCYPQKTNDKIFQRENFNNLQSIINDIPQVNYQIISSNDNFNCYPISINHFTACALPNDPMRIE